MNTEKSNADGDSGVKVKPASENFDTMGRTHLPSPPSLDMAKYRLMAGDIEVPEEELDEFLRTLWDIMNGFVQNAWDVKTIPAFFPEIFDDPLGEEGDAVGFDDEEDADDEA